MKNILIGILIGSVAVLIFRVVEIQDRLRELENQPSIEPVRIMILEQNQKAIIHNIATEIRPAKIGPFLEWRVERD